MRRLSTTATLILTTAICIHADDISPYSGTIDFPAQPHSWTATAYADFDLLLGKLGSRQPLDPASVHVTLTDGQALPTRVEMSAKENGRGFLFWSVPASATKFNIQFAAKSATAQKRVESVEVGEPDLLPNGSFDGDAGKLGWPLQPANPEFVKTVEDKKTAHSGTCCIKMLPWPTTGGNVNKFQGQVASIPVRVEPGRRYTVKFWFRSDNQTQSGTALVTVYWYRADHSYVRHDAAGGGTEGLTNWTSNSSTVEVPLGAATAVVFVDFYGSSGAFYVDDLVFTPQNRAQLTNAQKADGSVRVQSFMEGEGVRRFDFGATNSAAWSGFTAVTPVSRYDAKSGFGWLGDVLPQATVRVLPDDLARDWVSAATFQFGVDLPDGDYIAWTLHGDSGFGIRVAPKFIRWSIACNEQTLKTYASDAKTWYDTVMFRHFGDWWEPGVDVYDRFIASRFEENKFRITVRGGQAKFRFENLPLCALMIAPAARAVEFDREIESLRAARKAAVTVAFAPSPVEQPEGITPRDRKRGYAVFSRDLGGDILPNSAPLAGEMIEQLDLTVAPGEFESSSFAVYPMRNLGDVHVTVSDLRGPRSLRIPSSAIEVGVGRYLESTGGDESYSYEVLPKVVQRRDPMPMKGDMTVRWWLRLHVPDNATAGEYQCVVRIAPSKAPAFSLPLRVHVLPIRLEPVPIIAGLHHYDMVYWYTYFWQRAFGDDPWLHARALENERQNALLLQRYGINSLSLTGEDLRNDARFDGDRLVIRNDGAFAQWMDVYASAGMKAMPWYGLESAATTCLLNGSYGRTTALFSPEWERAYASVINWVKQQERERHWPEVILYTSDELSNEGAAGAEKGVKILQAFNRIRGDRPLRSIASVNGPYERVLVPLVSIIMPNHAYPITEESLAKIRSSKAELWTYNLGMGNRATWGFYLWRIGAKGRFQWHNCLIQGDPWSAFDIDTLYAITRTTPGEPLPSPSLIAISKGLDDLRYLATLEKLIAQASQSSNPKAREAAAAAQADLDKLRRSIPADARSLNGQIAAESAGATAEGDWACNWRMDKCRLEIAEHILKIQNALHD